MNIKIYKCHKYYIYIERRGFQMKLSQMNKEQLIDFKNKNEELYNDFKAKGLCLSPGRTLVRNIGLAQGTHFRSFRILQRYEFDREPLQEPLRLTKVVEPKADPAIEAQFAQAITDWGIRYTLLGKVVRFLYKMLKGEK